MLIEACQGIFYAVLRIAAVPKEVGRAAHCVRGQLIVGDGFPVLKLHAEDAVAFHAVMILVNNVTENFVCGFVLNRRTCIFFDISVIVAEFIVVVEDFNAVFDVAALLGRPNRLRAGNNLRFERGTDRYRALNRGNVHTRHLYGVRSLNSPLRNGYDVIVQRRKDRA